MPTCPLKDFPLDLGNTWVYTAISYAGYDTQTITVTGTYSETVVEVQWQPPFFAAEVLREYKPGQLPDGIEENDWVDYLPLGEWTDSSWYVISGTYIYQPYELDFAKLKTEIAARETGPLYVFPLSEGDCWDPSFGNPVETQDCWEQSVLREVVERLESSQRISDPGTWAITVTYSTMTQDDYQGFDKQIELSDCATDYCDCFLLLTRYNNGADREWFCPGIGSVGGFWNHAGTPFGKVSYLIDYSLQGSISATAAPTPTATPISAQNPLADFPLNLGNTWVYSSTQYDCINDCESDSPQIVTGTFVVTATVVDTRFQDPYFAARMVWESKAITLSKSLEGEDWDYLFHLNGGEPWSYWYVISDTHVYEQWRGLDLAEFEPSEGTLKYIFPLGSVQQWYQSPEDRVAYPNLEWPITRTDIAGRIELTIAGEDFDNCVALLTYWVNGPEFEYLCPGIGIAGGFYDHRGTPFGYKNRLMYYSFQHE
jgi:hypothetical protein